MEKVFSTWTGNISISSPSLIPFLSSTDGNYRPYRMIWMLIVCFRCWSFDVNIGHGVLPLLLSAGICSPVSTQNTIPRISSSTQAPSSAFSSPSCLNSTEYGYLESTNTDCTLDSNCQHWICSFISLLNFVFRGWEEKRCDLSEVYRLCGVIYEISSFCCRLQPEKI